MVMFHSYVELPEGTQHSAVKTDRREAWLALPMGAHSTGHVWESSRMNSWKLDEVGSPSISFLISHYLTPVDDRPVHLSWRPAIPTVHGTKPCCMKAALEIAQVVRCTEERG